MTVRDRKATAPMRFTMPVMQKNRDRHLNPGSQM